MDTDKDSIAERKRVRERRRARTERSAGDVPMEPGNKNDEQVAVRHADASGGYIIENQHEEKIVRDIQVSKRGSGAASEEQSDEWRKTERLEHEAPNTSASSDPCVALELLVSGEIQCRAGSVLVKKSGRVDDDVRISALDAFNVRDVRRSRYIGVVFAAGIEEKMPEISKELNWLGSGHVSVFSRRKLANVIRRF